MDNRARAMFLVAGFFVGVTVQNVVAMEQVRQVQDLKDPAKTFFKNYEKLPCHLCSLNMLAHECAECGSRATSKTRKKTMSERETVRRMFELFLLYKEIYKESVWCKCIPKKFDFTKEGDLKGFLLAGDIKKNLMQLCIYIFYSMFQDIAYSKVVVGRDYQGNERVTIGFSRCEKEGESSARKKVALFNQIHSFCRDRGLLPDDVSISLLATRLDLSSIDLGRRGVHHISSSGIKCDGTMDFTFTETRKPVGYFLRYSLVSILFHMLGNVRECMARFSMNQNVSFGYVTTRWNGKTYDADEFARSMFGSRSYDIMIDVKKWIDGLAK